MWVIEVRMEQSRNKGQGKREIPTKIRRPAASSGTTPTYENSGVSRADEGEARRVWSSAGMQRRGKREIPEKTRRPAASSGTIHTCENPVATPPGTEPSSPWRDASSLTTTLPPPPPIGSLAQ
ncbi:hypothetical protein PR048_029046 [Dryococelus australis]|uniref:Uncharacterized protein n=1 Tax=Dryococelus australis TaxID=614101 RepID=A0ABQ9GC96_9NEOP|nr:hypothetical protein PR048_029046 [Dryococelus australis]